MISLMKFYAKIFTYTMNDYHDVMIFLLTFSQFTSNASGNFTSTFVTGFRYLQL